MPPSATIAQSKAQLKQLASQKAEKLKSSKGGLVAATQGVVHKGAMIPDPPPHCHPNYQCPPAGPPTHPVPLTMPPATPPPAGPGGPPPTPIPHPTMYKVTGETNKKVKIKGAIPSLDKEKTTMQKPGCCKNHPQKGSPASVEEKMDEKTEVLKISKVKAIYQKAKATVCEGKKMAVQMMSSIKKKVIIGLKKAGDSKAFKFLVSEPPEAPWVSATVLWLGRAHLLMESWNALLNNMEGVAANFGYFDSFVKWNKGTKVYNWLFNSFIPWYGPEKKVKTANVPQPQCTVMAIINATPSLVVDLNGPAAQKSITLDGSSSINATEWKWTAVIFSLADQPGQTLGPLACSGLPPSSYLITLAVKNAQGQGHSTTVQLAVIDTTPPPPPPTTAPGTP